MAKGKYKLEEPEMETRSWWQGRRRTNLIYIGLRKPEFRKEGWLAWLPVE